MSQPAPPFFCLDRKHRTNELLRVWRAGSATALHDAGLSAVAVAYSSRTPKQNLATVACPGRPRDPAPPRRLPRTSRPSRLRPDNLPSRLQEQTMTMMIKTTTTFPPSLARLRPRPLSGPAETIPSTRPRSDRSSRPSCPRWVGPPPARPTPLPAKGRNATALLECSGASGRANKRAGSGSAAAGNRP